MSRLSRFAGVNIDNVEMFGNSTCFSVDFSQVAVYQMLVVLGFDYLFKMRSHLYFNYYKDNKKLNWY